MIVSSTNNSFFEKHVLFMLDYFFHAFYAGVSIDFCWGKFKKKIKIDTYLLNWDYWHMLRLQVYVCQRYKESISEIVTYLEASFV